MATLIDGSTGISLPASGSILNASGKAILQQTGSILQVVQGSTSTQVTVSTTTYTDTGLSASITPTSTSSKILVMVDQLTYVQRSAFEAGGGIRLVRGSTTIHAPTASSSGPYDLYIAIAGSTNVSLVTRQSIICLDSPSTTSATTYKTQGRPYLTSSSGVIYFQFTDVVSNATSYITLIEVAA